MTQAVNARVNPSVRIGCVEWVEMICTKCLGRWWILERSSAAFCPSCGRKDYQRRVGKYD